METEFPQNQTTSFLTILHHQANIFDNPLVKHSHTFRSWFCHYSLIQISKKMPEWEVIWKNHDEGKLFRPFTNSLNVIRGIDAPASYDLVTDWGLFCDQLSSSPFIQPNQTALSFLGGRGHALCGNRHILVPKLEMNAKKIRI